MPDSPGIERSGVVGKHPGGCFLVLTRQPRGVGARWDGGEVAQGFGMIGRWREDLTLLFFLAAGPPASSRYPVMSPLAHVLLLFVLLVGNARLSRVGTPRRI